MSSLTPQDLFAIARTGLQNTPARAAPPERLISIWEITRWILPMAPEHFRRVLAAEPGLPQGSMAVEGGTRWFSPADLPRLRAHFAPRSRRGRYQPQRPEGARAPLIVLTQPQGRAGRSVAARHLATAAALAGYRVLLIDADPAGGIGGALHLPSDTTTPGVAGLIARSAAHHLRRLNAARLDRGEAPLPMDETLTAALRLRAQALIRLSVWPGLDVMPASAALFQADQQIAGWRMLLRNWQPWQALAEAIDTDGLRQDYDLILCDPAAGLAPLALSMLASADLLLAPLPLRPGALEALTEAMTALATAATALQAEAQMVAGALGQSAPALPWRDLAVLPTRAGSDSAALLAGFAAKLGSTPLGPALLPDALPELAHGADPLSFYDLDYRSLGKLAYSPQRDACEAAWRGFAQRLAGLAQHQGHLPLT